MDDRGVLLIRETGVIYLADAAPVSDQEQRELDALCDLLGAPKHPSNDVEKLKPSGD